MGRARSSVALAGRVRGGRRWRHGVNSAVITADMCGGWAGGAGPLLLRCGDYIHYLIGAGLGGH